jgi:hypothetical protein
VRRGLCRVPLPAVNPQNFVGEVNNPYFPLTPGTTLRYKGEKDERKAVDVFEVTHQRKMILGVSRNPRRSSADSLALSSTTRTRTDEMVPPRT